MKNVCTIILILLFVFLQTAFAQANNPIESLNFRIRYGFVNAGSVSLTTQQTTHAGKTVYHTRAVAQTTGVVDRMFRFREVYDSFYSRETRLPYLSVTNLQHGRWRYHNENTYNQDAFTVHSSRGDSMIFLTTPVFDLISAISHFRTLDWSSFAIGEVIELEVLHQDSHNTMHVIYRGTEELSIGSGVFRTHRFVPAIVHDNIVQGNDNLVIWFSADRNRIPVSIRVNLRVGSFRLELENYERLRFPMRARVR